jgi:hypothetical protein
METIRTVFDDSDRTPSDYEIRLLEQVRKHGWRSTHVQADGKHSPSFTYTTGFWYALRQPEFIVFDFPADLAHSVLARIHQLLSEGLPLQYGAPVEGILSNETVCLFPTKPELVSDYLVSSDWFYKRDSFPCVQLAWPDKAGLFPWEQAFNPKLLNLQKDLSADGWGDQP